MRPRAGPCETSQAFHYSSGVPCFFRIDNPSCGLGLAFNRMLKSLLSIARVYRLFAFLSGADRLRKLYIETAIRPQAGFRILDIGCGPADILKDLPSVDYHGFDPNSDYIDSARRKFGSRGQFQVQSVEERLIGLYKEFDLVLATGVVHHLNDIDAKILFRLAHTALKPGGRLVTIDGCYCPGQSWIIRLLLRHDRGLFVRSQEEYLHLSRSAFSEVKASLRSDLLRIPYTHIILECCKREVSSP